MKDEPDDEEDFDSFMQENTLKSTGAVSLNTLNSLNALANPKVSEFHNIQNVKYLCIFLAVLCVISVLASCIKFAILGF